MTETLTRTLKDAVADGAPIRHELADGGVVFIDHAVPLLAVHRCAGDATGDPALDARAACNEAHRLVTTQPAYVLTSDPDAERARDTIRAVADVLADAVGTVLAVEVWSPLADEHDEASPDPFDRAPGFTLYTTPDGPSSDVVDALCDALSGIEIAGQGAHVDHVVTAQVAPPGLPPLGLDGIGLAVDAVFHNTRDGEFYPRVLGRIRRALAPALRTAAVAASGTAVTDLGRHTLEPAALEVDQGLSEVARSYGFLLQVTPVNSAQAWEEFSASGCESEPELLYRPLTFNPDAVRRDLYALPLDAVEDPVVAGLLRESRDDIGAHIRMILDVETPQFLPASVSVYGAPDDDLVALARDVIAVLDAKPKSGKGEEVVGATAFAAAARADLDHYHAISDAVPTEVEIRDDITASLMVSQGRLMVGANAQIPAPRVRALLAHEVGTHVLTYANGRAQPLGLLYNGLPGYQDLQEGLAVLGEWLVGGLTAGRFRTLAARVLGAAALADGASFVDLFRTIRDDAHLSDRRAFGVALRLRRGGGLTKDMVYLRGLRDLLAYLGGASDSATTDNGGAPKGATSDGVADRYWRLFVGKIALHHLPAIESLRARGVLVEPPLRPLYADDPDALARLATVQTGVSVLDLLQD